MRFLFRNALGESGYYIQKFILFLILSVSFLNDGLAISPTLHTDEWSVSANAVDMDKVRYRGQNRDLKDWSLIDPYDWFDFNKWKQEREIKDKNPDWKIRSRDISFKENIGRIIKCIGVCRLYRGLNKVNLSSRSVLLEGDEVYTEQDSYLWVFLVDGSLARISPKTSVSFNEVNLGHKKITFLVRLNSGHMIWQSRLNGEFDKIDKPETDTGFYPLYQLKANREYFAIREFRSLDRKERMLFSAGSNSGYNSQYKTLNNLVKANSKQMVKRDTEVYLYTPNMSVIGTNSNFEASYSFRSKAYIRYSQGYDNFKQEDTRDQRVDFLYRGYKNTMSTKLESDVLYEVDKNGSTITESFDFPKTFEVIKSQIARIPAVHLVRELWLLKYSKFLFSDFAAVNLASIYAYRLWNKDTKRDELSLRKKFLTEYIRRVETTNLRSIEKIFKNDPLIIFNNSYYSRSMRLHYNFIKNMYRPEYKIVREMSDTEYYLWTVRNAKK